VLHESFSRVRSPDGAVRCAPRTPSNARLLGQLVSRRESAAKRHLDRFNRFAGLAGVPNTQTTPLRLIAISRVYAVDALRPNDND